MSYILDALRRAEADRERERGQVPGLHAQPLAERATSAGAGPRRWLPWAAGGLLLLAGIGAGSWWASGAQDAVPPPLPQPATVPPPAQVSPVAAAPVPALPPVPDSPYLAPAPPPAAVATPAPVPAPTAAPPAPEARVPRLAELPDSARRELPRLTISGSVYSDDPASRFVMINGEVQREGARLGADLVLEEIRPRELVLRFKGQRFRQPV